VKALTFSVSLCVGSSNTTIVTPALRVYEQLELLFLVQQHFGFSLTEGPNLLRFPCVGSRNTTMRSYSGR